jgi:hypothetical protein
VNPMYRGVVDLIDRNRRLGQTTAAVASAAGRGAAFVVSDRRLETWVREVIGVPEGKKLEIFPLSNLQAARGRKFEGGVIFDNHAVYEIALSASNQIESLESTLADCHRKLEARLEKIEQLERQISRLEGKIYGATQVLQGALGRREEGPTEMLFEFEDALRDAADFIRRAKDA